jgi:hypothetical protein
MGLTVTIAEVLLGNLPLNSQFAAALVVNTLLYGSGALLIREVACRRHLGWWGVVALALAFGVLVEGLTLQSLFNPQFPGLEWMRSYGRSLGVNWFWMCYVLGLHTIWSITIPLLLTALLFPRQHGRPWLGRVGLGLDVVVFVLINSVLFRFFARASVAPPLALLGAALLVVALVLLALFLAPRLTATIHDRKAPAPWLVGLVAFLASATFSATFLLFPQLTVVPAALPVLLYATGYAGVALLMRRWSTSHLWSRRHLLALASGALVETMLFGFLLVSQGSSADLILHIALCALLLLLLVAMARRRGTAHQREHVEQETSYVAETVQAGWGAAAAREHDPEY